MGVKVFILIYLVLDAVMRMNEQSFRFYIKALSIDIGAYTQDIMFWNGSYDFSFNMIMPSPTIILANEIDEQAKVYKNLVITGETMGGGPIKKALINNIKKGLNVFMTEDAARSVRDDLEIVKGLGINIIEMNEVETLLAKPDTSSLNTRDVDIEAIKTAATNFGFNFDPTVVAVGVQDHGTATEKKSDREIRFDNFKSLVPGTIDKFGYETPPDNFTRMIGVKKTLDRFVPQSKHLIMDSKLAAMFGAYFNSKEKKIIVADVGNGHTTVGSIEDGELTGLFEHHTKELTDIKLMNFIEDFSAGKLVHKTIFDNGGHGCFIYKPIHDSRIVVSGPKRQILFPSETAKVKYANPLGDPMLVGNIGLTECSKTKFNLV
jgi:uncharacterized protein (DUF1786 family)